MRRLRSVTTQGNSITILDGGMSRELVRLGAPLRQPEWSALALLEAPETVREAHLAFARAGARVLTTNAYAVVPFHLGPERFAAEGRRLAALSAELARQYQTQGAQDLVQLVIAQGQGHNYWEGFFRCQALVDFSIQAARRGAE